MSLCDLCVVVAHGLDGAVVEVMGEWVSIEEDNDDGGDSGEGKKADPPW